MFVATTAADKKLGILFALCLFVPSFAEAASCFRSAPDAAIVEGVAGPGPATVSVLWNDDGGAMDQIRVDGQNISVSTEMNCGAASPITCNLGHEGGRLRLIFSGENRLIVKSGGLQVTTTGDNGSRGPRLSAQPGRWTRVNEMTQLTEDECRALFPNPMTIEVFPQDPSGQENHGSATPSGSAAR